MYRRALVYALVSAALFGLSTPAAKVLLSIIDPAILAGLLYSGAGVGVGLLRRLRPRVEEPGKDCRINYAQQNLGSRRGQAKQCCGNKSVHKCTAVHRAMLSSRG